MPLLLEPRFGGREVGSGLVLDEEFGPAGTRRSQGGAHVSRPASRRAGGEGDSTRGLRATAVSRRWSGGIPTYRMGSRSRNTRESRAAFLATVAGFLE